MINYILSFSKNILFGFKILPKLVSKFLFYICFARISIIVFILTNKNIIKLICKRLFYITYNVLKKISNWALHRGRLLAKTYNNKE